MGAEGSFEVFTGKVAKIEKKVRLLYSWRNRIGKKTGIFLSSTHLLPHCLRYQITVVSLPCRNVLNFPKRLVCKWTSFTIYVFYSLHTAKILAGGKEGNVEKQKEKNPNHSKQKLSKDRNGNTP